MYNGAAISHSVRMEFKLHGKVHAMDNKDERKQPLRENRETKKPTDPYIRAENEDDDGYDPYSDRRPEREPIFEADPWR